jgi:hypothetical protein
MGVKQVGTTFLLRPIVQIRGFPGSIRLRLSKAVLLLRKFMVYYGSQMAVTTAERRKKGGRAKPWKFSTNEDSHFQPDEYHKEGYYIYTVCNFAIL